MIRERKDRRVYQTARVATVMASLLDLGGVLTLPPSRGYSASPCFGGGWGGGGGAGGEASFDKRKRTKGGADMPKRKAPLDSLLEVPDKTTTRVQALNRGPEKSLGRSGQTGGRRRPQTRLKHHRCGDAKVCHRAADRA